MNRFQQRSRFAATVLLVVACTACVEDPQRPASLSVLNSDVDLTGFTLADQVAPIEFPRDHGAHTDFATEWWYLVGIVRTDQQRAFGFQYTLFRNALAPPSDFSADDPWRTGQIYMAHFAISDIEREEHVSFERLARGHPELGGVADQPFSISLGDWQLAAKTQQFSPLTLTAHHDQYAIDLEVTTTSEPILHGKQGLSWKSPTNASYYYSIPDLKLAGSLTTPSGNHQVSGSGWVDHEWSTGLLNSDYQGWYWLTLSLDDGRHLVLFSLVPSNEIVASDPVGLLVDENNNTRSLSNTQWKMTPIRMWKRYPVAWDLEFEDRKIRIEPAFDDQFMDTSISYWEGVVFANDGQQQVGEGFLELTGY